MHEREVRNVNRLLKRFDYLCSLLVQATTADQLKRTPTPPEATRKAGAEGDEAEDRSAARVKRWGIVVGLVAALVGLPGTIISLYGALHKKPNTALYGGSDLKLSYDPDTKEADFTFNFAASNSGNADDVVISAYGYLQPRGASAGIPNLPGGRLPIKPSAFSFADRETARRLFTPFSIVAAKSREIQCVASIAVSLLASAGSEKRLTILLRSKDRDLDAMSFCFAHRKDFFSSKNEVTFLNAQCN
jgi:hypothetical protein